MIGFVAAGKRGLRSVGRFTGRDDRPMFWFYVLWLMIAQQVLAAVLMFGMMTFLVASGGFDPVGPPPVASPDAYAGPPISFLVFAGIIVLSSIVAPIVLLSAAVVRRLHDRGLTGFWGLLVLLPILLSSTLMVALFASFPDRHVDGPPPLFFAMFASNVVYLVCLTVLIVLLSLPGNPAANRYGAPPS